MAKTTLTQIAKIKNSTVALLTYHRDRMTLNERAMVESLYYLMDDIVCDRVHHKHYTAEEYVDTVFMENAMILKKTKNSEVKKLAKLLEEGIKW